MNNTHSSPAARQPAGQTGAARWVKRALLLAVLLYLPVMLTDRAIAGIHLSNVQLLNLSLTQINLMLIAMLGALSLNFLTGCAGLISIGHAALYAVGAMTAATAGTQWGWPFPLVLLAAAITGERVQRLSRALMPAWVGMQVPATRASSGVICAL